MIPAPYGLTIARVKGSIMRCSKPPPAGWKRNEWSVLGGRQSGGIATIPGCGGELYHYGEFVGVLADVEYVEVRDWGKHFAVTETYSLTYVPAVWYLVG